MRRGLTLIIAAGFLLSVFVPFVQADDLTEERLRQLEFELQRLQAELEHLQSRPVPLPPVSVEQMAFDGAVPSPSEQLPTVEPPAEHHSMDQIRAEMKKLAWTKGDIQIVPYGALWGTTAYESSRSNIGDYVFYVFSDTDQGESAWHVDAKSTRLGIDFLGPVLPNFGSAQTGGKVEIDFQGQYQTENKGTVLLRHAYLEVKNEYFRLLAGQTWDVISPLMPGTIMYSVGWGAGNIGYRRAQFRAERYLHFSDTFLVTAQASINSDVVSEFAGNVVGDHSDWPVVEGRLGFTLGPRGAGCRPLEIGISGHIGEQSYDFASPPIQDDIEFRTWSFNVDARYPITSRFGVQGEFFTGENLGAYLGGVVQGVNLTMRDTIRSTGGWFDVWYDWTDCLHSHAGFLIDDPLNQDVSRGQRSYNHFYFVNLTYDVTKKFVLGLEVQQWKTNWVEKEPGDSYRLEFMAKYGF